MTSFLNTQVGLIESAQIQELLHELELVSSVDKHGFKNSPLNHFLTQCTYPNGITGGRVEISTESVPISPWLESLVGKIPDGDLRSLCIELAASVGKGLDMYARRRLYVLLNDVIPKYKAPKKPSEKRRRLDLIIATRRSNRR